MELFSSWTGSDFLLFYSVLLCFASLAAWWIPAHLREPGRRGDALDAEGVAYLVGGRDRLADSLIAELYVRGALAPAGPQRLATADPALLTGPAGQALQAVVSPFSLEQAQRAIEPHAERVAARLRRAGLLLRPEELSRLRWLSVTPFAAVLLLGLYRQRAGSAVGEPTGFLVVLLILTAVLAVFRFARSDPRTLAGIAAVKDLRRRRRRVGLAPRPDEAAMAVALFGTAVLVGTPWEPVHAMRPQGSSGDSGSSDSDGGGGGDGGGGCGGCGG